uniref:polysaccharide biosynthesis C-terminal domain-containing protein n=1 Tax=Hydrotalea lipotrueae TaxID=2803817 RepID=UPI001C484A0D
GDVYKRQVLPLAVALNIPAYLMLVVQNKQKNYFGLIVVTFFLSVLLNLILIPIYGVLGGAFAMIFSEIFIAISLHIYIILKCPELRFLNFRLSL